MVERASSTESSAPDRDHLLAAKLARLHVRGVLPLGDHLDHDLSVGAHPLQAVILAPDRHGAHAEICELLRGVGHRLVLIGALHALRHHVPCCLGHWSLLVVD